LRFEDFAVSGKEVGDGGLFPERGLEWKVVERKKVPFFRNLANKQFKVDFSIVRTNNNNSLDIK